MKSRLNYLALVLLFAVAAVLPARADSYKGTLTRQGTKMEYSFSGGVVTDKKLKGQGTTDMIVFVDGQVEAGSTVSATFKKLIDYSRVAHEVQVEISVETIDGKTEYLQDKKGKDAATASIKVPDNAKKVGVKMSYTGRMGRFYCFVDWAVVKKGSTKNDNNQGETISDEIKWSYGKFKYSISGGKLKKKERSSSSSYDYILEVAPGTTVTLSSTMLSKPEDKESCKYYTYIEFDNRETHEKKIVHELTSATLSYTIPNDVGKYIIGDIGVSVDTKNVNKYKEFSPIHIIWEIVDKKDGTKTPAPNNNFKWDDVAGDDHCLVCHQQFSNYFLRTLYGGEAVTICGSDDKKTNHKLIDGLSPIYYRDWIITGDDETVLLLDHCDDMGVMKILGRSKVLLRDRENGVDNWTLYQGRIVGRHQKSEKIPNPFFKMTMCTAQPNGAIYMLVDDHKVSRVFLFKGSIKVSCKTLIFTLKPGQVGTVDEYGEAKIQKFDVEAAAKKYGISLSGNSNKKNETPGSTNEKKKAEKKGLR